MTRDLQIMTGLVTTIDLCLNQYKCELYAPDLSLTQAPPFSSGCQHGRAIFFEGERWTMHWKNNARYTVGLSQNALILLRSSFGTSRNGYILRLARATIYFTISMNSIGPDWRQSLTVL